MSNKASNFRTGLLSVLKTPANKPIAVSTPNLLAVIKGNSIMQRAPAAVGPVHMPNPDWKSYEDAARVAFVIDATGSREPAWDTAIKVQNRMFEETQEFGQLSLRMIHFQGPSTVGVFPADQWARNPASIVGHMKEITTQSGETQIVTALEAAAACNPPPNIVVAIGDCCEESMGAIERVGKIFGAKKIPIFAFLEGENEIGREAYRTLARESGGPFNPFGAKLDLGSLMVAAAAYATGSREALIKLTQQVATRPKLAQAAGAILQQLPAPRR